MADEMVTLSLSQLSVMHFIHPDGILFTLITL